jgi:hypothetical protein
MRVLGEIIASDVLLLVTFNTAIDGVIKNNPKARGNPKALAHWTVTKAAADFSREIFSGSDGESCETGVASGDHRDMPNPAGNGEKTSPTDPLPAAQHDNEADKRLCPDHAN